MTVLVFSTSEKTGLGNLASFKPIPVVQPVRSKEELCDLVFGQDSRIDELNFGHVLLSSVNIFASLGFTRPFHPHPPVIVLDEQIFPEGKNILRDGNCEGKNWLAFLSAKLKKRNMLSIIIIATELDSGFTEGTHVFGVYGWIRKEGSPIVISLNEQILTSLSKIRYEDGVSYIRQIPIYSLLLALLAFPCLLGFFAAAWSFFFQNYCVILTSIWDWIWSWKFFLAPVLLLTATFFIARYFWRNPTARMKLLAYYDGISRWIRSWRKQS